MGSRPAASRAIPPACARRAARAGAARRSATRVCAAAPSCTTASGSADPPRASSPTAAYDRRVSQPGGAEVRIGIVVNPAAGRDVRRLAARAASDTPQGKRNGVARAVIGAAAAGATHFSVVRDPFQIGQGAVENLRIDARFEVLDLGASLQPQDTPRAVEVMRKAGCRALIVLGGDGTNRLVAR